MVIDQTLERVISFLLEFRRLRFLGWLLDSRYFIKGIVPPPKMMVVNKTTTGRMEL